MIPAQVDFSLKFVLFLNVFPKMNTESYLYIGLLFVFFGKVAQ